MLTTFGPNSYIGSELLERCAEMAGRFELCEVEHRVIPLVDRSVILLDTIV